MTSNRLPTWQQFLNQKLVQRLNNPLTEPGIINNRMAKKIIERSPDLLDRLPLLAQQMQRWSTVVDLESEEIPIVYVQHQEAKQNSSFPSSDPNPGKKQLPLVKAKVVQSSATPRDRDKKQPLVDVRSQPTASALTQDNSLPHFPDQFSDKAENLAANTISNKSYTSELSNPAISVTASGENSTNPIQRKLDSGTFSSDSASLNIDSETPVVYERMQTPSSGISEQPLVNLSQPTANSSTDINPPLISVTAIGESSVNPIQRKLDSATFSSESASLNLQPEMPVVYGRTQTPLSGISEQPLVNLSQPIANLSTEINNQDFRSIPIIPINPVYNRNNQNKFDNSAVVYSQPLSPKLASTEPILLIQEFERNNPSVVSKEIEKIPQSPILNPKSDDLPVVEVNYGRSPPEFEPLIFSASPIAKQKASSLNGEALNYQPQNIAAANHNRTSSTHQETSIVNSSNQSIITASTSSPNAHQQPKVNQTTKTSLAGVNLPPQIDVDALADKVERKIMRRLVVESERRGKKKWR